MSKEELERISYLMEMAEEGITQAQTRLNCISSEPGYQAEIAALQEKALTLRGILANLQAEHYQITIHSRFHSS